MSIVTLFKKKEREEDNNKNKNKSLPALDANCISKFYFFCKKFFLYVLDRFDMLVLKIIFKK
jgi:hypothetical protein